MVVFTLALNVALEVDENDNVDIVCGTNQIIVIESATWRYDKTAVANIFQLNWRKPLYPPLAGVLCSYDKLNEVKSLCHGKGECHFIANRATLGNECNFWLTLDMDYRCYSCDQTHRLRRWTD